MQPLLRVALLLLSLSACGGADVRPGTPAAPNIRRVGFVGNRHVDAGTLRRGMGARSGTPFADSQVALDARGIVAHYRQHGYFNARVTDVKVTGAGPGLVDLVLSIDEGAPTRVREIVVDGAADGAGLEALLGLRRGDVFRHAEYLRGKARIRARLVGRAHRYATVSGAVEVDPLTRTADIRLTVDPGPVVRFGKTRVEGATLVPPSSVTGRIAWREGEVYDESLVELTRDRLYALGRFGAVRIRAPQDGRPAVADMVIHVSEGTRHELRAGGGVAADSVQLEARLRGGYAQRGFVFPMTTVRVDAKVSNTTFLDGSESDAVGLGGELRASTEHEDFLAPMLRLTNEADYALERLEAYALRGARVRAGVRRQFLRDRFTLSAGWQLRFAQDYFDVSAAISDEERVRYGLDGRRVGHFEQALSYDLRDRPIGARQGLLFHVRLEEGNLFAGGAFDYVKLIPEVSGYLPLGAHVTLAARSRLGVGAAPDAIPITQRFFGGGPSSHRGFALRHLAPFAAGNATTAPIGGEGVLETSVEMRLDGLEVWGKTFGLGMFLDGADVTLDPADLDPFHLHWATGIEVRIPTPLVPVRGGVGLRLNRRGDGEPDEGSYGAAYLGLGDAY